MNKITGLILSITLIFPIVTFAEQHEKVSKEEVAEIKKEEIKDLVHFHKMIDQSAEVYAAIIKGESKEVPMKIQNDALCVAVLPNVVTAAVVVGGAHGVGLVSCKNADAKWSQPAVLSLNQGNIGLQVGAKSTDVVLFLMNKDAVQSLKNGDFVLGTDLSAVAGNYDSSVDTETAKVIAFTRTEGLFAGAAIGGSKIGKEQADLDSYYGMKVDRVALLEGRVSPDSSNYAEKLTKLFR